MLCITISNDRVLQLESTVANSLYQQFMVDNIVCPLQLRKQLFTCGAIGNVFHNPSSCPHFTVLGICCEPLTLERGFTGKELVLP